MGTAFSFRPEIDRQQMVIQWWPIVADQTNGGACFPGCYVGVWGSRSDMNLFDLQQEVEILA